MDKHTSLELSKKLYDAGFNQEHGYAAWVKDSITGEYSQLNFGVESPGKYVYNSYPAYDILNDLCVKYAKELFGEGNAKDTGQKKYEYLTQWVLEFLQKGEKLAAENVIWTHCILNKEAN